MDVPQQIGIRMTWVNPLPPCYGIVELAWNAEGCLMLLLQLLLTLLSFARTATWYQNRLAHCASTASVYDEVCIHGSLVPRVMLHAPS